MNAAPRTLLLIALLALVRCVPGGLAHRSGAPATGAELTDTHWVITSLDGEPLLEGTRITVAFGEDRLSGFAGCNRYGAGYAVGHGGALAIVEPMRNAALCTQPEGVMDQEDAFVRALCAADAIRATGDRLEIDDEEGTTRLVLARQERETLDPAALVGTRWELVTLAGAAPLGRTRYTLSFDSTTDLSGEAGCRTYRGTYDAEGDALHLRFLEMGGDPCLDREDVMRQEGDYTTALESIEQYHLTNDRLELVTQPGEVLLFSAAN